MGSNGPVLYQPFLPRKRLKRKYRRNWSGKPGFCVPGTQKCAHGRFKKVNAVPDSESGPGKFYPPPEIFSQEDGRWIFTCFSIGFIPKPPVEPRYTPTVKSPAQEHR
jgi:hypothetical protein